MKLEELGPREGSLVILNRIQATAHDTAVHTRASQAAGKKFINMETFARMCDDMEKLCKVIKILDNQR